VQKSGSVLEADRAATGLLGRDTLSGRALDGDRDGAEGEIMTRNEVRILPLGLYRLFWKVGGASVASVGYDAAGNRWYAPANWIGSVPCFDWSTVKSAHMIAPALCYEEPAEDEQEDTLPASRSPEAQEPDKGKPIHEVFHEIVSALPPEVIAQMPVRSCSCECHDEQEPGKAGAFEETLANCDSLVDVFSQYGISGYGLKVIKAVLAWARSRAAEPKGAPRRIENTSARMPRVPPKAVAKGIGAEPPPSGERAGRAEERCQATDLIDCPKCGQRHAAYIQSCAATSVSHVMEEERDPSCRGERCAIYGCERPADAKVAEEIPLGKIAHGLTAYVCRDHHRAIFQSYLTGFEMGGTIAAAKLPAEATAPDPAAAFAETDANVAELAQVLWDRARAWLDLPSVSLSSGFRVEAWEQDAIAVLAWARERLGNR
jgi:hypothetical protein